MMVKRKIKVDVEQFEVGDVIKFKLTDGEKVSAMAVRQVDNGMLFVTVDCLNKEYKMFENPGNMGSMEINYFNSDLRHALNGEILDRFPEEIRSRMVGMRIGCTDTFDLLRIPTEEECKEIKRFKCMKKRRNRIAFNKSKGEEALQWYWLQNRVEDTASYFALVNSVGNAFYNNASYSGGVRPVFLLS